MLYNAKGTSLQKLNPHNRFQYAKEIKLWEIIMKKRKSKNDSKQNKFILKWEKGPLIKNMCHLDPNNLF